MQTVIKWLGIIADWILQLQASWAARKQRQEIDRNILHNKDVKDQLIDKADAGKIDDLNQHFGWKE